MQLLNHSNPDVQKKCIGDAKPITCRPADLLDNEMDKLEKEVAPYKEQDEDVLSYALFPQVATDFFKYRQAQKTKVDEKAADKKNGAISGIKTKVQACQIIWRACFAEREPMNKVIIVGGGAAGNACFCHCSTKWL